MVTRSPNQAKNMRGGWPRGALRLTAMLIAAVALLGVSAFADDTTNTQYAQTTYALVVDTGAATKCTQKVDLQRVDAEVGDCMEFFRIVYKDANGVTKSHYVFPDREALQESLEWAEKAGEEYVAEPLTAEEQTQKAQLERAIVVLDLKEYDSFKEIYKEVTGKNVETIFIGGRRIQGEYDWDYYRKQTETKLSQLQAKDSRWKTQEQKKSRMAGSSKFAAEMGYPVKSTSQQKPFQAYSTDTYLFKPLTDISSVERIEFCATGSGSWACQDIRLYKVDEIYGLGMNGYVSNDRYVDFSGTLLADMSGSKTFNWTVDHLFQVGPGSLDGANISKPSGTETAYTTSTKDFIFRLDIKDTYGAGVEALANAKKSNFTTSGFCEVASLEIAYKDTYGNSRLTHVPVMLSALGYANELGVATSEYLSGMMQQGETLALRASLSDFSYLTSVTLVYGNKEAVEATGIAYAGGNTAHATRVSDMKTKNAGKDEKKGDTLEISSVSVYEASTPVTMKVESTMLRPVFSGQPVLYASDGTSLGKSLAPGDKWTLALKEYDGRILLSDSGTNSDSEKYLIKLTTDDSKFAATSGDVEMVLEYRDLNGSYRSSAPISLAKSVADYYGYWPGVSENFAYQSCMASGKELVLVVPLKNVDIFTGARFRLNGTTDDWQMKGMSIYQLNELNIRDAAWETVEAGRETSDRRYFRTPTLLNEKPLLELKQKELVDSGDYTNVDINSGSTVENREDQQEDWSEYRYSMSYDTTRTLGDFTKTRYTYRVAVKVAENTSSNLTDGDCGSRNLFFFQLIFQNGKSGYVLANQQLTADGFRTGEEETFTIKMNQDYGELTAVRIIPEDPDDKTDLYDKLNVESINVRKESYGATSRQWVIGDVGWIGLDYRDGGEDGTVTRENNGRSEDEFSWVYQVDYSTQVVNLQVEVATGSYQDGSHQLVGQVFGTLKYYDGSGQQKSYNFDAVAAMYQYMGKTPTYPSGNTKENAISNSEFMFRAEHTDRFMLSVNDVSEVVGLEFLVKNTYTEPIEWTIKTVAVSLMGTDSRLTINDNEEYERIGATEKKALCTSTSDEGYTTLLPTNTEEPVQISFTHNTIEINKETYAWSSSVAREPNSANDTMNLYVYLKDDADPLDDFTMQASVQFSKVYGGCYQTSCDLTADTNSGGKVLYALGLNAAEISTLNKVYLKSTPAWVNGEWVKDESDLKADVDHAVVQQVRSGVVINSYYIGFVSGETNLRGTTGKPTDTDTPKDTYKQVVSLSFGEGTEGTDLIAEKYDIAVSLQYTTTNDADTGGTSREYSSPYVYLTDMTDKTWLDIQAGKVVDVVFHEGYVDQITGVNLVVTGNMKDVVIDAACVGTYKVDPKTQTEVATGWFSFANGLRLSNVAQTMKRTSSELNGDGTVKLLTLSFTTADAEGAAESGINVPVSMRLGYRGIHDGMNADTRELPVISDLIQYASDDSTQFATGSTVTTRFLLTGVDKLKWMELKPVSGDKTWNLDSISGSLQAGAEKELFTRSHFEDRVSYKKPLLVDLYGIGVHVEATTDNAASGTTTKEVQNGSISLLVDSAQPVTMKVDVTNSGKGFEVKAEEVDLNSEGASTADKYLSTSGGTITFTPPKNDGSANVNYRVTITSKEVPTVKSVVNITVKFEKKPDEAVIQDSGKTTSEDNPSESNPLTPDSAPAGE